MTFRSRTSLLDDSASPEEYQFQGSFDEEDWSQPPFQPQGVLNTFDRLQNSAFPGQGRYSSSKLSQSSRYSYAFTTSLTQFNENGSGLPCSEAGQLRFRQESDFPPRRHQTTFDPQTRPLLENQYQADDMIVEDPAVLARRLAIAPPIFEKQKATNAPKFFLRLIFKGLDQQSCYLSTEHFERVAKFKREVLENKSTGSSRPNVNIRQLMDFLTDNPKLSLGTLKQNEIHRQILSQRFATKRKQDILANHNMIPRFGAPLNPEYTESRKDNRLQYMYFSKIYEWRLNTRDTCLLSRFQGPSEHRNYRKPEK